MRDILFRGQAFGSREWIYGHYRNGKKMHIIYHDQNSDNCYAVLPETVGQFTGLSDRNGKKIFEGDIVKFTDSPFRYSYNGAVCFHEGSFCIQYKYWGKDRFHKIGQTDKWQDMGASGIVTYEYEIIGNIHDNPELLEK